MATFSYDAAEKPSTPRLELHALSESNSDQLTETVAQTFFPTPAPTAAASVAIMSQTASHIDTSASSTVAKTDAVESRLVGPSHPDKEGLVRVGEYIDRVKESNFYSGVILVAHGDKVVRQELIQPKGLEQKELSHDTPFNILSVGKLFTTAAIMQLVEQGKVSLNMPIKDLLQKSDYELAGCDEIYEGEKLCKDDFEAFMKDGQITVQHLLTHTAGLIPSPIAPTYFDKSKVGTAAYSNYGYQLLARVVERVNPDKLSFLGYVEKHIMKASGIEENGSIKYLKNPPKETEQASYFASRPSGIHQEYKKRIPNPDGNGCFWMTVSDLFKFAQAFSTGKLIKEATKEKMCQRDAAFADSTLGVEVFGEGSKKDPRSLGKGGRCPGASSGLQIIEAEKPVTLICLSNVNDGNEVVMDMMDAFKGKEVSPYFAVKEIYNDLKKNRNDSKKLEEILNGIQPPGLIAAMLVDLEAENEKELITSISKCLTSANIEEVAVALAAAGNKYALEKVQEQQAIRAKK